MRRWIKLRSTLICVLALCVCWMFQGCRMCDVCIIDAETGRIHRLPCNGFRQWIVAVNDDASEFTTLVTRGRCAGLRTYGFNGELRCQKPCFQTLRNLNIYDGFGATKDVGKMIYRKNETGHLYMIDSLTAVETLVCLNIASSPQWDSIKGLEWVSATKVLLLLNADNRVGRSRASVDILDVITKERRTMHSPKYIDEYALSPDRKRLAIVDGRWEDSIVRVIDIGTGNVICSTERGYYNDVCWCDNNTVGYVSHCKVVMILPLAERVSRSIYTMPEGLACYALVFGDGFFAVNSHLTPTPLRPPAVTPMLICDLATGRNKKTLNECFNGRWFAADKGKKIICETGF